MTPVGAAVSDPKYGRRELRETFSCFATGVTIVTTRDATGSPRGMTANSFTSVSLDPPLVLVCIALAAPIWPAFAQAETFAINVLANHQGDLSQRFSTPQADKFIGVDWRTGVTGAPVLADTIAYIECRRCREVEAGDHMILLGEVIDFAHNPSPPLVFHRGAYAALVQ